MKLLKFVPPVALEDHLLVGWEPLYASRLKARQGAVWVFWAGEGCPRHPEVEKLVSGHAPGRAGHSGEDGSD